MHRGTWAACGRQVETRSLITVADGSDSDTYIMHVLYMYGGALGGGTWAKNGRESVATKRGPRARGGRGERGGRRGTSKVNAKAR